MDRKYVCLTVGSEKCVVLLPPFVQHSDTRHMLAPTEYPVSAGFYIMDAKLGVITYGESASLALKTVVGDATIIQNLLKQEKIQYAVVRIDGFKCAILFSDPISVQSVSGMGLVLRAGTCQVQYKGGGFKVTCYVDPAYEEGSVHETRLLETQIFNDGVY